MNNLLTHVFSALVMLAIIAFSFYMIRNTKGKMSEGFKIMIIGHLPLMIMHVIQMFVIYEQYEMSELKISFLDETAQIIAALSIFIAIYLIKTTVFGRGEKNEN